MLGCLFLFPLSLSIHEKLTLKKTIQLLTLKNNLYNFQPIVPLGFIIMSIDCEQNFILIITNCEDLGNQAFCISRWQEKLYKSMLSTGKLTQKFVQIQRDIKSNKKWRLAFIITRIKRVTAEVQEKSKLDEPKTSTESTIYISVQREKNLQPLAD